MSNLHLRKYLLKQKKITANPKSETSTNIELAKLTLIIKTNNDNTYLFDKQKLFRKI